MNLNASRKDKLVHVLFAASVIGKGLDGALEVIGGVLLFFVTPAQISHLARMLTLHELSEDPRDIVANFLLNYAQRLSQNLLTFSAIYLLWHGMVKVGLVIALLQRRLWAYPVAILAFLLFIVYQLYRYSHTRSPWLLALSALDVFVILFTSLEYKRLRSSRAAG